MKNNTAEKISPERNVWKGILAGAVAGLAASFVMSKYQSLTKGMLSNGNEGGKSEPATVRAAEAVSENVFGHELKKKEKAAAGEAMHYLMGGVSGAFYGGAAEYSGLVSKGLGFPFGSAVWAIADDVVVPALGLSKSPTEYPFSTHAYALSSHWVYGLTSELVRKAVRGIL